MRAVLGALIALCVALPAVAATPASNEAAAKADAASLLTEASLPAGAEALSAEPDGDGGALAAAPMQPATANLVTRTAFFRVPQPTSEVVAWVEGHAPAQSVLKLSGSGDSRDGRTVEFRGFDKPALAHRLATRTLLVSATRLDDGSTGIRMDAQVVWLTPRAAGETIRGARLLSINAGKRRIEIASAATVRQIAGLLNDADPQQPGVTTCPAAIKEPPHPRLTFRARRNGPVIAYAHIRPTGCARADMVVGGKRFAALDLMRGSGAKLVDALRKLGALSSA